MWPKSKTWQACSKVQLVSTRTSVGGNASKGAVPIYLLILVAHLAMMAFAPPLELLCLPARLAIQIPKNDSADLAPWEWNFDPCPQNDTPGQGHGGTWRKFWGRKREKEGGEHRAKGEGREKGGRQEVNEWVCEASSFAIAHKAQRYCLCFHQCC